MTPTHAPTPCLEQGCFALAVRGGRCAPCALIHRPAHEQGRESARDRGYDARWERRRRRHLSIEPTCRVCADGSFGNQVDHVVPHRGARWLFDLEGNLQTLCEHHHAKKSALERTIPIGMMYPLDLPEPPHARPTLLLCGPNLGRFWADSNFAGHDVLILDDVVDGVGIYLQARNELLRKHFAEPTQVRLTLIVPAPRTAARAFWSHVMGCPAELVLPGPEGQPPEWWGEYELDWRAEDAMERRGG